MKDTGSPATALRRIPRIPWIRVLALAAFVAIAIAAGSVLFYQVKSSTTEVSQVSLIESGWRSEMFTNDFSGSNVVLSIAESPGSSLTSWIHIIDVASGRLVGTVEVTYNPMPLLRNSRSELLVSDVNIDTKTGDKFSRLLILDTDRDLALKTIIPLPDRIEYPLFTPGIALSQNEQFFYYLKRTEICVGSTAECDVFSVGVIDLDQKAEVAVATLPRNCGFAQLQPLRTSDMLAMCPNITSMVELTSSGGLKQVARFVAPPMDVGTGVNLHAAPISGGMADNGRYYMIFQDGTVQMRHEGGTLAFETDLLPQEGTFFVRTRPQDVGRTILGFNQHFDEILTGAVLFDSSRPGVAQLLMLPPGTRDLAPTADGKIAALHAAKVSLLDPNSGLVAADTVSAPVDSRWLVGQPATRN